MCFICRWLPGVEIWLFVFVVFACFFVWMRASPTGVVVLRLMLPRSSAGNETDRSDPGQSSSKRLAVHSEAGLKGKKNLPEDV